MYMKFDDKTKKKNKKKTTIITLILINNVHKNFWKNSNTGLLNQFCTRQCFMNTQ